MNKLIATLTIISLFSYTTLAPSIAWAEDDPPVERVTTVNEGDPAPFTGTLFSTAAAAKLLTDLKYTKEECKLETQRQLSLQESQFKLKLDTLEASRASLQLKFDDTLVVKNDQIDFLKEQIKPKGFWQSGEFWFGTGVVAGILVTVAAGYAIGQAAPGN